MQINNGAGINFAGNTEVDTELQLTDGIVNNGSNVFTLAELANVNPTGGSSSSYVNGQFRKVVADGSTFEFPIGKSRYAPLQVEGVSSEGIALTWRAEYFQNDVVANVAEVDNMDPFDASIVTMAQGEYWRVSDDAGTDPSSLTVSATVNISWGSNSNVSATVADYDDLRVMWWDDAGNHWDNAGFGGHAGASGGQGSQSFGKLSAGLPITFSERVVTMGSTTTANPLPVEFLSFDVTAKDQQVKLTWKTASEINNDFFEVQRSADAKTWEAIGTATGAGNSTEVLAYDFTDTKPLVGTSYYRLRQVDFDGRFEYSKVRSVNVELHNIVSGPDIRMYPNPTNGFVMLRVSGLSSENRVIVKLLDVFGKIQEQVIVLPSKLEIGIQLNQRENLPAGLYFVDLQQGKTSLQRKLIIH